MISNKETGTQKSWDTGPRPQSHASLESGFSAMQSDSTAHARTTPRAPNLSKVWEDFLFFSPNPRHAHDFAEGPQFSWLHFCTCCQFARWPSPPPRGFHSSFISCLVRPCQNSWMELTTLPFPSAESRTYQISLRC